MNVVSGPAAGAEDLAVQALMITSDVYQWERSVS